MLAVNANPVATLMILIFPEEIFSVCSILFSKVFSGFLLIRIPQKWLSL